MRSQLAGLLASRHPGLGDSFLSLEISLDKQLDPFAKRFEECSKPGCGGRLGLRVENLAGGTQQTSQVCRKCGAQIPTAIVRVQRVT